MSDGQVVESNSATAVAEPVTNGQPAAAAVETPENQNGQASPQGQSASVEESFSSIDPKTLPPELQAVYKSMQSDYTKKTSEIADTRKKAQAYDQLSADQRFKEYWTGLSRQEKGEFREQKAKMEESLGQKISDDDFAKAFESKDNFLGLLKRVVDDTRSQDQTRIQELEQKLTESEAGDVVEMFATEVGQDGKPIRPDFNDLDKKHGLITGFLTVNPPSARTQEAYMQKLNEAYAWAKAVKQEFYNQGKADALSIIQKKTAASSEMPTNATKSAYTGPDPKKITAPEAWAMAKKGQRIPQVYD